MKPSALNCALGTNREYGKMAQKEIEIEISKDGSVRVHIEGVKGAKCMEYAKKIANSIGIIEDVEHTSEYYEPETEVGIDVEDNGSW